jgi:hypothetical protein
MSYTARRKAIARRATPKANSVPTNNRDELASFHEAMKRKYGSHTKKNTLSPTQILFGNSKGNSYMMKDIGKFFQPTNPNERTNKRGRSLTSSQLQENKSRKLSAASAAAKLRDAILNPPSY